MTSSLSDSMPRPGVSGTSMKPFWMIGLGRPLAMSSHQGVSMEWFSNARKFSVAAALWTAAIHPIGDSAM